MLKRHELAPIGQGVQRLAFPARCVVFNQVQTAGRENKETTVDQPRSVAGRLLRETDNRGFLQLYGAVTSGWLNSGNGGPFVMLPVKGDLGGYIDVREPVAVGETE